MIGQARLVKVLVPLMTKAKGLCVSIYVQSAARQVFRFAQESIHQDVRQERLTVTFTVMDRNRVGIASTDSLDSKRLRDCLAAAQTIAAHAPAIHPPPAMPERHCIRFTKDYDAATANFPPEKAVDLLCRQFRRCKGLGA